MLNNHPLQRPTGFKVIIVRLRDLTKVNTLAGHGNVKHDRSAGLAY